MNMVAIREVDSIEVGAIRHRVALAGAGDRV